MLDELREAVFEKSKELFKKHGWVPPLKITFSNEGYYQCRREDRHCLFFSMHAVDAPKICIGCSYSINPEQTELFIVGEA